MIREEQGMYALHTAHTTYVFRVMETGQLEHLYYGRRIRPCVETLAEKHYFAPGNTNVYDQEHLQMSLEDACLEISSRGKGDVREPFLETELPDGCRTADFVFQSAETGKGKEPYKTLPGSYDETGEVEWLRVTMKDNNSGMLLELSYFVYADCDVITRSVRLLNQGEEKVQVRRLMSMQLDLTPGDYVMTSFHGAWVREMRKTTTRLVQGKYVSEACMGTSSSRSNPFFMIGRTHTTDTAGECMGFNLIYSGNHYEAAEVSSFGKVRIVSGIHPSEFCWTLEPGEAFEAPEAVMTWSGEGYRQMSANLHQFVREHIVRGEWKHKTRPVLLNSWEAAYFDINEQKLLKLAKAGKEAGIELFVMDDGWFGDRTGDTKSLGDWEPDPKKLPGGLKGLVDKVKALGLDFGIWVEPEMVNVDSKLYERHPEWSMEIPGRHHTEGRNQRFLDLANPEVQEYIIEQMSKVFSAADISYVKWDMNRVVSDSFSAYLPADRQGEAAHRYVLGLYRCMKELTERFPHILFEGCAAGGNRFDLGILSYFPQIWASDNTDALCRAEIQNGYSYGYPMSVVSAHVSGCPNHQTLRVTPLASRFAVAAFGVLGYECNLCDMSKEEREAVKEQIALYKQWREVLQTGTFYRGRSFSEASEHTGVLWNGNGNLMEWTCVSKDKRRAVGFIMQKLVVPNTQFEMYHPQGLDEEMKYRFYNQDLKHDIRDFGDLINTVAPVHIAQDSVAQRMAAKFIKLDGEKESAEAYGDALMYGGVKLAQAFSGSGYNSEVRHFPDFAARLYFMEALEPEA